jgi:hypothetical protein
MKRRVARSRRARWLYVANQRLATFAAVLQARFTGNVINWGMDGPDSQQSCVAVAFLNGVALRGGTHALHSPSFLKAGT